MTEPVRVADVLPGVLAEVIDRASNRYDRWAEQVAAAGYCAHPIRLAGRVEQVDRATGELRQVYDTADEPDGTLLKACGTRRASRCPSCASGTPQSPSPCPSASAARNSRSHRSGSRRWPLTPPMVRRSEALRPRGKLCPIHSRRHMPVHLRRQGRAHECFGMAAAGTAWIRAVMRSNIAVRPSPQDRRGRATGEDAAQTHCRRSASNRTQDLISTWGCALHPAEVPTERKPTNVYAGHRLGGAPRRNRTTDPILTMNHREPLCKPPYPQVTSDRRRRSYRFSFGRGMRSLSTRC
jgi:hypothetical protein